MGFAILDGIVVHDAPSHERVNGVPEAAPVAPRVGGLEVLPRLARNPIHDPVVVVPRGVRTHLT